MTDPAVPLGRGEGGGVAAKIFGTDQMGKFGKLSGPGKFLQNAPQTHESRYVYRWRQGAQVDEPAEDMRVAAQLTSRNNIRMILTEINQEVGRGAPVWTG